MIIGFGKSEIETASRIIGECIDFAKNKDVELGIAAKRIQEKYAEAEKEYKKMSKEDAPERYSYFYFNHHKIYDGLEYISFKFHHINRRHALSPDGWALFVTKWMLEASDDEDTIFREA